MRRFGSNFAPSKTVFAVDASIAGDVVRVVLDGCPGLKANCAAEALEEMRAEHEAFRRFLIEPPRGHDRINAALLLPPYSSGAARTAIMAEHFGYVPVAGTLLITAAVVLVDTGQVSVHEPETVVILDTAHGPTELIVTFKDGRATSAKWTTYRPKIVVRSQQLSLENGRTVPATVISPGLPYVVVRAEYLCLDFRDVPALGASGAMLSRAAGQQLPLRDLGMEQNAGAYLVMLVGSCVEGDAGKSAQISAAWVGPRGGVSHSPAGTGALAVAAYCVELGELAIGEPLDVVTPYGHRLCSQISDAGANVEGTVRIVAGLELYAD